MHHIRIGSGKPLLLVHGVGASSGSWEPVLEPIARSREVIAVDLSGHGASPAEADSGTFVGLARSLEAWLDAEGLGGVDMVGSSLGGRLVLEMARRGKSGATVALDPGGFWAGGERLLVLGSLTASAALLRTLRALLPALATNPVSRSALMAQLSARPWALTPELVTRELTTLIDTPNFDALVRDLAFGPMQEGPEAPGSGPVTIGWGRRDRLCLPVQAERAQAAFPTGRLHWFERSGHFPLWDQPRETVELILQATS